VDCGPRSCFDRFRWIGRSPIQQPAGESALREGISDPGRLAHLNA
jgi:hypothetical protein